MDSKDPLFQDWVIIFSANLLIACLHLCLSGFGSQWFGIKKIKINLNFYKIN